MCGIDGGVHPGAIRAHKGKLYNLGPFLLATLGYPSARIGTHLASEPMAEHQRGTADHGPAL